MKVGIEVRGLRVVYDRFVAVADTSFRVEPGESFGSLEGVPALTLSVARGRKSGTQADEEHGGA